MDMQKTGQLIAQRRKDLELTQQQLADSVGVTYKAISRWETGRGFPDAVYLQPLSQALELSITEIVNGTLTIPETAEKQIDDALLAALTYSKSMSSAFSAVLLAITGLCFLIAPQYVTGINTSYFPILGALLLACAGVMKFWKKWPSPMHSRYIGGGLSLAALVLQILPVSAVLVFRGPDYYNRTLYSCFDLMLVGYASFGPFLSATLNVLLLVMLAFVILREKAHLCNTIFICTLLSALLMAVGPILFGGDYWSVGRAAVILLQLTSAALQARANGAIK